MGYRHILSEDLAHAVSPEGLNQGLYFGYEYLPANMAKPPQPTPFIDITACELTPGSIAGLPQRQHFTRLDFDLEALTPCTIHISQFYSALLAVSSSSGDVNISAQGTVSVDLATGVNIITIETKSIYELVL